MTETMLARREDPEEEREEPLGPGDPFDRDDLPAPTAHSR